MTERQQGFLLTRHSRDQKNQTEIVLWLATDDGPAKLLIEGERPLFFVLQSQQQAAEQVLSQHIQYFELKPLPLKTFAQQPVTAVYFSSLHGYYDAKELLQSHHISLFESDFRLQERYLMERFVCGGLEFIGKAKRLSTHVEYSEVKIRPMDYRPPLTVISLDVECSMKGDLYSIGFFGQVRNLPFQLVIMIGEPEQGPQWIEWVANERALLHALERTIKATDPDVLIGWNVVNFDFKLLLERAQRQQIGLRLGRGGALATWRDSRGETNQGFVTLPGRVVIDGIDALKTATYNFPSFSLEHVSQTLLGRGKQTEDVANRGATITDDFLHNKQKLAHYNLADCELVWDIFEHTKLLDFMVFRSHLTGLELDRSGGSVAAFTNLYLPKLHRAGYVAPNLPADGGLASPGGFVMSSRPGLYKHVLVLDFKSLYPSIIRTFKIDPMGLIEGLLHPDPEQAIPGFKEAFFSRQQHFLPQIITDLWQQRDQAKLHKDAPRSQAIKILMNSFYGVLGSGGCRFYDTRLASSITLRGHEIMQQTALWIEQQGFQVIYGDTDSTFVWLNGDYDSERADNVGKALIKEINQRWQQKLRQDLALECFLEIEYETHFSRFLMPTIRGSEVGSKKRYAGLISGKDGDKLVFKGLETVRTDWTELAKEFQTQLYENVFHDQDPSTYIREVVAQTRAGERDHQLVYRKRLRRKLTDYVKNVPPHVRAARLADEHNSRNNRPLQYQHKGSIAYVITTQGPEPLECLHSPLDYDHYIEKQLQPVADAILPFIGLTFDQLINQQMGLF